jgi:hypothetical protein
MAEFSYERYCREASLIGDPASCLGMVKMCRDIGVSEIACLVDFGADVPSVIASLPDLAQLRQLSLTNLKSLAVDPSEESVSLPETEVGLEELDTVLAAKLFE